jgi:hypothetical protein
MTSGVFKQFALLRELVILLSAPASSEGLESTPRHHTHLSSLARLSSCFWPQSAGLHAGTRLASRQQAPELRTIRKQADFARNAKLSMVRLAR